MEAERIAIELASAWLALDGKYRAEVDPDAWLAERERLVALLLPIVEKECDDNPEPRLAWLWRPPE